MRVTQQMRAFESLRSIELRGEAFARAQRQLSTGLRVERAGDDPAASARILRLRSELARNLQFQRNLDTAQMRLGHAELSLQRVDDLIVEARAFAVQAASGTWEDLDRELLAQDIDQLLESLVGEGNRKFVGQSLFAGSHSDQAAFAVIRDGAGRIASVLPGEHGTLGAVHSQLTENETIQVNFGGVQVFMGGEAGSEADLFATLIDLRDGLLAGDPEAPESAIGRLDLGMGSVNSARAALGSRMQRVLEVEQRLFSRDETLTTNLSADEDVDLARASMQFALEQVGYEAALQAVARVFSRSLMDFIR
jgi:flagellar hook-associated protein 3 FlgL